MFVNGRGRHTKPLVYENASNSMFSRPTAIHRTPFDESTQTKDKHMSKSALVDKDETVLPDGGLGRKHIRKSLRDTPLTRWQPAVPLPRNMVSSSLPTLPPFFHDDLFYITTVNAALALTTTARDRA